MSCASNKTTAETNFDAASYSPSFLSIQLNETTQLTDNTCTLTSVRGKVELDLTDFTGTGTCTTYFKVSAQSDGSSNSPPVTANGTYIAALSATLGQVNTSAYYANTRPTFTTSCTGDDSYGWVLNDQVGAVQPTFTYFV